MYFTEAAEELRDAAAAVDEHGIILPMKPKYCMCPSLTYTLKCGSTAELAAVHSVHAPRSVSVSNKKPFLQTHDLRTCQGWFMELDDSRMSRWCLDTARQYASGSRELHPGDGEILETLEAELAEPT